MTPKLTSIRVKSLTYEENNLNLNLSALLRSPQWNSRPAARGIGTEGGGGKKKALLLRGQGFVI